MQGARISFGLQLYVNTDGVTVCCTRAVHTNTDCSSKCDSSRLIGVCLWDTPLSTPLSLPCWQEWTNTRNIAVDTCAVPGMDISHMGYDATAAVFCFPNPDDLRVSAAKSEDNRRGLLAPMRATELATNCPSAGESVSERRMSDVTGRWIVLPIISALRKPSAVSSLCPGPGLLSSGMPGGVAKPGGTTAVEELGGTTVSVGCACPPKMCVGRRSSPALSRTRRLLLRRGCGCMAGRIPVEPPPGAVFGDAPGSAATVGALDEHTPIGMNTEDKMSRPLHSSQCHISVSNKI